MVTLIILIVLILVIMSFSAFKPTKKCYKCYICDFENTERTKFVIWEFDDKNRILCLKCSRKLEAKQNKEKFDAFLLKEYNDESQYELPKYDRNISPKTKNEVWQRDRGRCIQCGSNEKLEYDHVIPISKGGSNTTRNIQLLCENCNRRKSSKIQ